MSAPIKILRDCDATLIPSGDEIKLIKGTLVRITQALGGDFTLYVNGNLVKISGRDAEAIGHEVDDSIDKLINSNDGQYSDDLVWAQLKTCFDPEIPVNIYDLGLIYDVRISEVSKVDLVMTLTSPHCPVAEILPGEVKSRVEMVVGVDEVDLELTWDPPWTPDQMSEAAKLELGFI